MDVNNMKNTQLKSEIAYFLDKSQSSIRLKISSVIQEEKKVTFVAKKLPTGVNPDQLRFAGFRNPLIRVDTNNMNTFIKVEQL